MNDMTLLLHTCCAPCASAVIERLAPEYDITLFFYNPNIHPQSEKQKRLEELKRFLTQAYGDSVKLIQCEHNDNVDYIPACCEECFLTRLEKTAETAKANGFDYFATTLTVGSKKKATTINPIAAAVAGRYKVEALLEDFGKKNGYNRSVELSKKHNLYRQDYCGCANSLNTVRAITIIKTLKRLYPNPHCELKFSQPHELLIATRLSAQCTDKRVNATTPELFKKFPTIEAFATADIKGIEAIVKPCGFYRVKSADIKGICIELLQKHNGVIPDDMETLLQLPGVGRKTANLILGELYGQPAIVADTHVIRLSNRLGLAFGKDAFKVETQLRKLIPDNDSLHFCHRMIQHGRAVCKARNPLCGECDLKEVCVAET